MYSTQRLEEPVASQFWYNWEALHILRNNVEQKEGIPSHHYRQGCGMIYLESWNENLGSISEELVEPCTTGTAPD